MRYISWLLIIAVVLTSLSCSMELEKRRYNKGFYSKVHKKQKNKGTIPVSEPVVVKERKVQKVETVVVLKEQHPPQIPVEENTSASSEPIQHSGKPESEGKSEPFEKVVSTGGVPEVVAEEENTNNDHLAYLLAGGMFLTTVAFLRGKRKLSYKGMRWARQNKWKGRFLIAGLQFALAVLGCLTGVELINNGIQFSEQANWAFKGSMLLGFGLAAVSLGSNVIKDPRRVFLSKIGHLVIGISAFGICTTEANKRSAVFSWDNTYASVIIPLVDDSFSKNEIPESPPIQSASAVNNVNANWLTFLYVLLAIGIVIGLAAACCAIACEFGNAAGVAATIGAVLLLVLIIYGMSRHVKRVRAEP